jgi:hypothetical protein
VEGGLVVQIVRRMPTCALLPRQVIGARLLPAARLEPKGFLAREFVSRTVADREFSTGSVSCVGSGVASPQRALRSVAFKSASSPKDTLPRVFAKLRRVARLRKSLRVTERLANRPDGVPPQFASRCVAAVPAPCRGARLSPVASLEKPPMTSNSAAPWRSLNEVVAEVLGSALNERRARRKSEDGKRTLVN